MQMSVKGCIKNCIKTAKVSNMTIIHNYYKAGHGHHSESFALCALLVDVCRCAPPSPISFTPSNFVLIKR